MGHRVLALIRWDICFLKHSLRDVTDCLQSARADHAVYLVSPAASSGTLNLLVRSSSCNKDTCQNIWRGSITSCCCLVSRSCPTLCSPTTAACQAPLSFKSPGVSSNSCPLSQWCQPTISSSVVPLSSCLQFFPASGSFLISQRFASVVRSIGVSALASVLPMSF